MIALTVHSDYLTVDTEEWLDSFSEVSEEWTNVFRAYCQMRADAGWDDGYVTSDMVKEWAESLGKVSGIYGEDSPVTESTCNVESFLENDITYTFLYITRNVLDAETGESEEHSDPFIITHGAGYSLATAGWCDVRLFNGDDDTDAFSYARGYAAHDDDGCSREWIIEDTVTMWNNGGTATARIDECIREDADSESGYSLYCPNCNGRLTADVH